MSGLHGLNVDRLIQTDVIFGLYKNNHHVIGDQIEKLCSSDVDGDIEIIVY